MNDQDRDLIERLIPEDPDLKDLWENHLLYSEQVKRLENMNVRTPQEEQTLKQLKKQKLDGKTKLMTLLDKYRANS